MQISIRNADFGGLFTRLKLAGPLPLTTGSLDAFAQHFEADLGCQSQRRVRQGAFRTSATGSFRQFNISAFRALASKKAFFRMSDIADTAFDFDSLERRRKLRQGIGEVHSAKIVGRNETVTLNGVVPFRSNGLALSGAIKASDPTNAPELPMLPFFIGGTWPDPVISPVATLLQKSDQQPQQQ